MPKFTQVDTAFLPEGTEIIHDQQANKIGSQTYTLNLLNKKVSHMEREIARLNALVNQKDLNLSEKDQKILKLTQDNQILRNKISAQRLAARVSVENSFKDQLKEVLDEFFNQKLKKMAVTEMQQ